MILFNSILVLVFSIKFTISKHSKTIECIKYKPCTIICNESDLCINSQINCPINKHCNITCNPYSCHSTIINANHSSSFTIHVNPNVIYNNLTIYLPFTSNIHIHKLPISNTTKHISQQHTNQINQFQFIVNQDIQVNIN
eukprot:13648_1